MKSKIDGFVIGLRRLAAATAWATCSLSCSLTPWPSSPTYDR